MKLFTSIWKALLVFITLSISFANAQNIIMGNGNATACSGTFYDSGFTGNYANSQNLTFTVCPDTPGSLLEMNFTSFDVENGFDFLTIYNGATTAAPTLGTYSGTVVPGLVQGNNPTGCLTFVFTSDGSVTNPGWTATISCTSPCQDVVPDFSTNPGFSSGTNIDVCQGQTIDFSGSGIYPQNGTSYTQSDATSTFEWFFGDGNSAIGQMFHTHIQHRVIIKLT